ncbi:TPA: HIT domain-containing protein [Serratia fonticola]
MPINDGHILTCPKEHYDNITDLPEEIIFEIFNTAKK